ncbi:MAG TPA: STAS domain-containing protein [Thermoleophilaceae bacterium]|jgi:anti-anti-sigma factor|nr:STAS domain-containing protein [Thermoleophilaceae bacterium]
MPQLGQIHSARRDDTYLFRLTGEFDLSNAWKIKDALIDAIRNDDRDIVVDLTAVRFMDAQLVRVLVRAREAAARRDIAFVVVPPADPTVSRVAELVDFEEAA